MELYEGEEDDVWIVSGSGSYYVTSSNASVATATINDNYIHVTAGGTGTATITITDTKSGQTDQMNVTVKRLYVQCPDNHHPHMIDLGLSSGLLWACCNVDTEHPEKQSPTNYGGYYAWGEVEEKSVYSQETYLYYNDETDDYVDIGEVICGTEYDVAVKWGNRWWMPDWYHFDELLNECTFKRTQLDGVKGCVFIGPNGNTIFLPAAGYKEEATLKGTGNEGEYWSSDANEDYTQAAYCFYFTLSTNKMIRDYKNYGASVRPVTWSDDHYSYLAPQAPKERQAHKQGEQIGLKMKDGKINIDPALNSGSKYSRFIHLPNENGKNTPPIRNFE